MKNSIWIFAAAASLALLTGRPALAATNTWGGNTDTDWATTANWTGGLPVSGAALVFGTAGTSGPALTNTLTGTGFNISGITFNAGSSAFTFSGNTFTLTAGITNSGTNTQTFNNNGGLFNSVGSTFTVSPSGGIIITGGLTDSSNGNLTTTVNGAGGTLTLGSFTLNSGAAAVTDTLNGSGNINITGAITNGGAGANALTYSGTGTLTIGGVTSYTGASTFSNGTTNLTGTMNTTGNVAVNNAATIFNESSTGAIAGTGTFTLSNGVANFAGNNSYTGATVVTGGVFNLSGTLGNSGIVVNNAAGTFNETSAGVIAGTTGSFTISAGTATLAGSNTMSGGVKVSGGTLNINNANALGAGTFTLTGGTIDNTSGGPLTLTGLSAQSWGGNFIFTGTNALDLGTSAVTMTANTGITVNSATNALTEDGAIGGAFGLTKSGVGTLILTANNGYSGSTSISKGILDVSGASGALSSTSSIGIGAGAELLIDDRGAFLPNHSRINDSAAITINNGGSIVYQGTNAVGAPGASFETVNSITPTGIGIITVINNSASGQGAKLTASSIVHAAGASGIAFVNGNNLGGGTLGSGVSQVILSSAPTLIGTTAATGTGINSAVKNTKIVPYLIGESGMGTGQVGTVTGTANTFLTYDSTTSTGLRPLNPTDEYTGVVSGTVTNGNNIYITSNSGLTSSGTINSLVINGGDLAVGNAATLTDSSGALLFVTGNAIGAPGSTGGLVFGNSEGIITVDAGMTATINSVISGTSALSVYGGTNSTLVLAGSNTYTGNTTIGAGATLAIGNDNALGTSKIVGAGGTLKSDNQSRTIGNTLVNGSTQISIGGSNNLTFTGSANSGLAFTDNTYANQQIAFLNTATTTFSGTFSLNNASSGGNNSGSFVGAGSSANVVITGPITDNNAGNIGATSTNVQFAFIGFGGNITIAPTLTNNGYGISNNTTSGVPNVSGYVTAYNTLTVGGPGGAGATITPFGAGYFGINGAQTFYFQAATNGQILGNSILATGGSGTSFGFAGANSLTLGGTYALGAASTFTNISTGGFTFGSAVNMGSNQLTVQGSGNTTFNSASRLTGTGTLTTINSGIVTLSGTNTLVSPENFNGGTVVLDYSAATGSNSSKVSQGLTLGSVNLQLNGGSFAQTLVAGLNLSTTGTTTVNLAGQNVLTVASTTNTTIGQVIVGTGIPVGTVITGISGTTLTLSNNLTSNVATGTSIATNNINVNPGTILGGGQTNISQTGGGSSTIALGVITRTANAGGVINFGTGVATTSSLNTTTAANGIMGGWATVNGSDWAVSGGTAGTYTVTALASGQYTTLGSGATTTTGQYLGAGGAITTGQADTVNSLKLDQSVGTLTLGGTLTISSGGLLVTGAGGALITGNAIQSAGNLELFVQQYGTGTLTIASNILNAGGTGSPTVLVKSGTGTLVLSGNNTYGDGGTNGTYIDQGTLSVSADTNLGTANSRIAMLGGTLETTSGFTTARSVNFGTNGGTIQVDAGTLTLNGILSGTEYGGFNKTGSGTLVLNGANTYTGPTTIAGGTLQLGNALALGASTTTSNKSTSPVTVNGGTLDINGNIVNVGNFTLASGNLIDSVGTGSFTSYSFNLQSGTVGASLIDDVITADLAAGGGSSVDLYKTTAGTVILTGNNTYSGATQISAGTLQIGNGGGTGTLGTANVTMTGGTLAFNRNNAYTVANAITGAGAVSQIGSGTTILTNSNSYSGGTTVSAGTLVAANTTGSATGSGALTVGTGGTLAGVGIINSTTNTINGAVQAGFVGTATNTTGNLTLTSSSSTTFSGASMNLQFNLSATTLGQGTELNVGSSAITFGGVGTGMTLTFNLIGSGTANITDGTQYILFAGTSPSQYSGLVTDGSNHITNFNIVMTGNSLSGATNQAYYSGSYLQLVGSNIDLVVAVPEPGTWVLMLGGLALLVVLQRARRSRNS